MKLQLDNPFTTHICHQETSKQEHFLKGNSLTQLGRKTDYKINNVILVPTLMSSTQCKGLQEWNLDLQIHL